MAPMWMPNTGARYGTGSFAAPVSGTIRSSNAMPLLHSRASVGPPSRPIVYMVPCTTTLFQIVS